MHGASESHLADHAGKANEQDKNDIRNQKGRAAEFADAVGEHPDVCHAY